MRAINHALTGAIIGLTIAEPLVALPVALMSHFVLDAIPHYGESNPDTNAVLRSKSFKDALYVDAALCFVLVLVIVVARPLNWILAGVCAFIAAAPDFASIGRYIKVRAHKPWNPNLSGDLPLKFSGSSDRLAVL